MDQQSRQDIDFFDRLLAPTSLAARSHEILARAHRLGVDPLVALRHFSAHNPDLAYHRAAEMLGVAFEADISDRLTPVEPTANFDLLGGISSWRGRRDGRTVLYIAPTLDQLMMLNAHIAGRPEWRETLCIVSPRALRDGLAIANSRALLRLSIQRLARRFPLAGAHLDLSIWARGCFVTFMALVISATIISIPVVQPLLLALVTTALLAPSIFRLWAAFTFSGNPPMRAARMLHDDELPVYSVLIPLRDEAHMVPQIARAMRRMDYPAEKLDVIFVVESASSETVLAARRETGDARFSLVVVPKAPPHTKPKALNFALPLVRGEHVVVFDAEDVPDPAQLRQAASLLAQDRALECLQAELVIVNGRRNWIAHMFAAEYAGHFGVLLPAIARARLPMPLGGTSNHFRTATLRRIGAWDAFNVTEDADLGIRMARLGLRVASFSAVTCEEAPESVLGWARQRSRWMKGWMQTLLVHSRRPARLLADLGWRGLLAFYVFVGGMVLAIAMHGLFLIMSHFRLLVDIAVSGAPDTWTLAGFLSLALGYCGAAVINVIGLERLGKGGQIVSIVTLPLYWLIAWYALMLAVIDLLVRPYHWEKTRHLGLPQGKVPEAEVAFRKLVTASSNAGRPAARARSQR